jgi:hypothetical protein
MKEENGDPPHSAKRNGNALFRTKTEKAVAGGKLLTFKLLNK